jgi:hypothetical protein
MTRRIPAWLAALTLAAGCGQATTNTPPNSEAPMTQSETPETSPSTPDPTEPYSPTLTETESRIVYEILAVSATVKRYLKAVTAKNEAEEAEFTCAKKHPSLLWISAMGRPITFIAVTTISTEHGAEIATVKIQVGGQTESDLSLSKVAGEWCVQA